MGVLSNNVLIRASRELEEFLYRRSALITGQTRGIVDNIQSRFPNKEVALITNGVDVAAFLDASISAQRTKIRREFALEGKFVIGYAGLHGLAQGLDTVIHAARLLVDHQDVLFAFFGDGPEKEKLVQQVDQYRVEKRPLLFVTAERVYAGSGWIVRPRFNPVETARTFQGSFAFQDV